MEMKQLSQADAIETKLVSTPPFSVPLAVTYTFDPEYGSVLGAGKGVAENRSALKTRAART